jgi:hypothetical protein
MELRRLETLVLCANGIFWLVFAFWIIHAIEPVPTNASELQDTVNYAVSPTTHLPYEVTRSSAMWRLCSLVQFPSAIVSRLIIPSFRADSTFLRMTLLIWRLALTMLLSFGQWFALAKALRALMHAVAARKHRIVGI